MDREANEDESRVKEKHLTWIKGNELASHMVILDQILHPHSSSNLAKHITIVSLSAFHSNSSTHNNNNIHHDGGEREAVLCTISSRCRGMNGVNEWLFDRHTS